jgi:hypothetical protein
VSDKNSAVMVVINTDAELLQIGMDIHPFLKILGRHPAMRIKDTDVLPISEVNGQSNSFI